MTKDELEEWRQEIYQGQEYRRRYSSFNRWEEYKNAYRGDYGNNTAVYNKIFTHIRTLIPTTYSRTPACVVHPTKAEKGDFARLVEVVDNYLLNKLDFKSINKALILDAAICGTAFIKIGYDSQFGYSQKDAQPESSDNSTLNQLGSDNKELVEYYEDISPGMPWAMRIPPEDMVTPFGYADIKEFPWIAHRIIRKLSDVKNDKRYSNTKDLVGGYVAGLDHRISNVKTIEKDAGFIELYEIRDIKKGRVYVIAETEVLLDEPDELQIGGLPYKVLIFSQDPNHFHGISDVGMVMGHQYEINDVETRMKNNRAYGGMKFLYSTGALDDDELAKFTSTDPDDIGTIVAVNVSGAETLQSAIQPVQHNDLTQNLNQDLEIIEGQLRDTLGFSRNQSGEYSGTSSATATEAQIVSRSNDIRTNERKDLMADVMIATLKKWNRLIFTYWDISKFASIAGDELATKGLMQYDVNTLDDDLSIVIDPDNGMPISQGMRTQQMIQLYQLLVTSPLINQQELLKRVLSSFQGMDASLENLILQDIPPMMGMQPPITSPSSPSSDTGVNQPKGKSPQDPNMPMALEGSQGVKHANT